MPLTGYFQRLLERISSRSVSSWRSVDLVDIKTKGHESQVTGRPQCAICIFCRKQIAAWPTQKKRRKRYLPDPPELKNAVSKHSSACATDWAWETLARWKLFYEHHQHVTAWRQQLERDVEVEGLGGMMMITEVLGMFARLPSPMGSDEANAVEIMLQGICYAVERWPETWTSYPHGTPENPHVYFDSTVRAYGLREVILVPVRVCPCGHTDPTDYRIVNC